MSNKIISQIVIEKESPQAYGPPILENLLIAVTNFGPLRQKVIV